MLKKLILSLTGILATGPNVHAALSKSEIQGDQTGLLKSSLFHAPRKVVSESRDVEDLLRSLAITAEKSRLQGEIFGLNEKGEIESLGTREELELMKSEVQRLQILIAGVRDVNPTTTF
ncbi:MAG: hypothetical protein KF767_07100 [Bdellovibrionaceae bacterium]|nr:hypothetical protein [Pseudobdellovibrionaceae bacterium]